MSKFEKGYVKDINGKALYATMRNQRSGVFAPSGFEVYQFHEEFNGKMRNFIANRIELPQEVVWLVADYDDVLSDRKVEFDVLNWEYCDNWDEFHLYLENSRIEFLQQQNGGVE